MHQNRERVGHRRLALFLIGALIVGLPAFAGAQVLDFSCHLPSDTVVRICAPGEVHIPIPSDGICEMLWGPGQLIDGEWVYFVDHRIRACVAIRCLDESGAVLCTDTFCVLVEVGDPPVCQAPEDRTIVQCLPEEVRIPLPPTNLLCEVVAGPGEIIAGEWVYTPLGDETVTVTIRCYNECEAWCEDNFTVTFETNNPPECNLRPAGPPPPPCEPSLAFFVEPVDSDGDPVHCVLISGPGMLTQNAWMYYGTPGETFTVVIRCYDEPCGDSCESSFTHTFPQCVPPTCLVPNDTVITQCDPVEVALPVVSNGECGIIAGPGTLADGYWRYTPAGSEAVCVTIQCVSPEGETCQDEFCVTFEVNAPPEILCPIGMPVITQGDIFENDVIVTDGDDPSPTVTIWKITRNGDIAAPHNAPTLNAAGHFVWDSDSDDGTWCFFIKVEDECASDDCSFCVTIEEEEEEEFCTLTQGFYGNCGGYFQGESTKNLIKRLITPGSPLVIGKPGRSVTFPDGTEHCIVERLPAKGTPGALPAIGDAVINSWWCNTWPSIPTQNGRFCNVLLGQTIALSLNVRLDVNLGGFEFCEMMRSVDDDDTVTVYIPREVFRALTALSYDHDVDGLLRLANRALGGGTRGGATFSQINCAVDAINRLFDECRTLIYCGEKICHPEMVDLSPSSMAKVAESEGVTTGLSQNSPNPFNASTQITFTLSEPTDIDLSVYNILGQKVITLDRGYTEEGTHTVIWDGRDSHGQTVATGVYFYRFIAGDVVESKKMLLVK